VTRSFRWLLKSPKATAPSAAEIKLLTAAGIVANDPEYMRKAAELFKQRVAATRPATKPTSTTTVTRTMIPSPALADQATQSAKIAAFLATPPKPVATLRYTNEATAFLQKKGFSAVANGTKLVVSRIPGATHAAPGGGTTSAVVLPPPVILDTWHPSTPNSIKMNLRPGDEFALTGTNFTPSTRATLDLGGCPMVDLQVLTVAPNGTSMQVRVPPTLTSNLEANYAALGVRNVNGASNEINVMFLPPTMQLVSKKITVTEFEAGSHNPAHAWGDGGLGLVEGVSMFSTTGGDRTSCCDDNFFMNNDGVGGDTFFKGVNLVNGWWLSNVEVVPTCKDGSHTAYPSTAPCAAFIGTQTAWLYSGGSSISYDITFTLHGPAGMRPLSSMPKVGQSACEQ
jgi:hypothetical protein